MPCSIVVAEAKDEDLFMIEKTGDDRVYQKKLESLQSNRSLAIDVSQSKLRKISSNLKLYGKLESTSNVPAVRSQEPFKEKRKTIYNDDDKLKKFWNDRKHLIEKGKQLKNEKKKDYVDPKNKFKVEYDLWEEKKREPTISDHQVNPQPAIRVPAHLRQKPSLLPAVEVPIGGQSYNPDQKQHNELILEAANKEAEKINEERLWATKVEKYFVSKEDAPNERTWITEMSQGLGLFEHENQPDEEESPENLDEIVKFAKLVKSEKKTKQQRRRELRERLTKKQKESDKKLRIKENEIFRLKSIKKELDERDKKIAKREQIRNQRHIDSLYQPKRLSRYRFQESEIALNLPGEVSGSLRAVKVEGNLLEDRFKSLQKRNLIEPRVHQNKKRKFKLKHEVKRRHRPATQA